MEREEAMKILELYRNWNEGQRSTSLAMHGIRTAEDDLLDARRELIKTATKRLAEDD